MRKHVLRKKDKNGKSIEPVTRLITSMMKGLKYCQEKAWILVAKIRQGVVGGCFSSVVPGIKVYVKEWSKRPAVQIYYLLLKTGLLEGNINKMLTERFDLTELVN